MADISYKAEGVVRVNSRLNVRSGAGTNYSIIGKLYAGNKVNIVAKTSDSKFNDNGTMRGGYKIEYKGSYAYVCTRYVNITKEHKEEDPKITTTPNEEITTADYYILTGTAKVEVNLDINVRQIVNLQGLGNKLSGGYYVETVEIDLNRSGITQSISVSKNAFGGSVK